MRKVDALQPVVGQGSAVDEDVAALRRLIEYAIDEAMRNGLFNCGQALEIARRRLEEEVEGYPMGYGSADGIRPPLLS